MKTKYFPVIFGLVGGLVGSIALIVTFLMAYLDGTLVNNQINIETLQTTVLVLSVFTTAFVLIGALIATSNPLIGGLLMIVSIILFVVMGAIAQNYPIISICGFAIVVIAIIFAFYNVAKKQKYN